MSNDKIMIIVRTLMHQGHINTASKEIREHLKKINSRYKKLKQTLDFLTSAEIARAEWLKQWMKDN